MQEIVMTDAEQAVTTVTETSPSNPSQSSDSKLAALPAVQFEPNQVVHTEKSATTGTKTPLACASESNAIDVPAIPSVTSRGVQTDELPAVDVKGPDPATNSESSQREQTSKSEADEEKRVNTAVQSEPDQGIQADGPQVAKDKDVKEESVPVITGAVKTGNNEEDLGRGLFEDLDAVLQMKAGGNSEQAKIADLTHCRFSQKAPTEADSLARDLNVTLTFRLSPAFLSALKKESLEAEAEEEGPVSPPKTEDEEDEEEGEEERDIQPVSKKRKREEPAPVSKPKPKPKKQSSKTPPTGRGPPGVCKNCKSAKVRCDRGNPCSHCEKAGKSCVYPLAKGQEEDESGE